MAFHTSDTGRWSPARGWATRVSPTRARATARLSITRPTIGPIGQSGSSQSTTSDRPLRSDRAAADGA